MEFNLKKTEWDLSPLLKSDDDPAIKGMREKIEHASYAFINKWKDREDYLKDPKVLKEALDEYEQWGRNFGSGGNEGFYFSLRTSQDQNNPELKARYTKIDDFSKKIQNDIRFFKIRLSKIPQEMQKNFLESKELQLYHHFIERLFTIGKYTLSEPEEKILNLKGPPSYAKWVEMVSGFISKEQREVLGEDGKRSIKNFSEISNLIMSKNKKVRDSAGAALHDISTKNADIAEAELNAILLNKKIDDELRQRERPDTARHVADDIDSSVVDTLIDAVSKRFDIAKRFYKMKAGLFKVDKLAYHERNAEYGSFDKQYSYEDSMHLIYKVFRELDPQFGEIVRKFAEEGRIDVAPKVGKRSGAFCSHELLLHPIYVLVNHTGRLRDVTTLAHELGHGINYELMKRQPSVYFGTGLATAEVASTFMEDFVLKELMKGADDELRLSINMTNLADVISTIIRQVACYKFEQELHKEFRVKGYLSKEEIGKLFRKNMEAYMGESVEQSPGSENWWVHWPHIRRYFYVYSYASGLLISKSLQNLVHRDHSKIKIVKDFLSAGLSDSPKNIFMKLGIDITKKEFWNKGLDEIDELLNETENLAKKLKKI
ncbi:M3 family oligoendopeptidase [Candidatus Pacearchaeota archaeon]|nr:M3 family oligoendopeptidase [Candidatus Pacearchaeota archaeon]